MEVEIDYLAIGRESALHVCQKMTQETLSNMIDVALPMSQRIETDIPS